MAKASSKNQLRSLVPFCNGTPTIPKHATVPCRANQSETDVLRKDTTVTDYVVRSVSDGFVKLTARLKRTTRTRQRPRVRGWRNSAQRDRMERRAIGRDGCRNSVRRRFPDTLHSRGMFRCRRAFAHPGSGIATVDAESDVAKPPASPPGANTRSRHAQRNDVTVKRP